MAQLTEEELILQEQEAEAKAQAEADQQKGLESEITARTPWAQQTQEVFANRGQDDSPEAQAVAAARSDREHKDNARQIHEDTTTGMYNPIPMGVAIGKGVANAGLGAARTAVSVGGAIGGFLGDKYDEYAPSVGLSPRDPASVQAGKDQIAKEQQTLSDLQFKPKSQMEKIVSPMAQVGTGFALGSGVVKGAGYLAGTLAGSLGGAAAAPDQEGVLVKDKGYIGLDIKPTDDPSTAETKKFLNLAMDNVVTTIAADGVARTIGGLAGVGKRMYDGLRNWRNTDSIEKEYLTDLIDIGASLGENPTREQRQKALEGILERTNKMSETTYPMGPGIEDKTITKDPVSILTDGLDASDPAQRATQIKLESLRASAKAGNAPKTSTVLEQPRKALDSGLSEIQTTRGGDQAIEQTRQNLQDSARLQSAETDVGPNMLKNGIETERQSYQDALKNDPTFGPAMKNAEQNGIPLNIDKTERDLKSGIVSDARTARLNDKEVRDAAYKAVSDTGVAADMDSFKATYEGVKDFIPAKVQTIIDNADGTFGYLNNQVRPRLSDAITEAYKAKNPTAAEALQELRDNITKDQLKFLRKSGNKDVVELVDQANKANMAYAAKWNDGLGGDLAQNDRSFRPNTQPIKNVEGGRDIVDSAITNPNRKESIDQLKGILGPGKEGQIADTALAKATKDIQAGKGANVDKITSDLQQMAHNFGPKESARLEGFINDVRNKKMTIDELEAKLPDLQKAADAEKEDIFGKKFGALFEKSTGKTWTGKENGYRAFQKAMDDNEPAAIHNLINEAKKNPQDLEGLQAAWAKSAEEKLGSNSKEVVKFAPEFEKYGKDIFGDNPALDSILELKKEATKLQKAQVRTGIHEFDTSTNQTSATTAISALSTLAFGVLNPRAARLKVITGNISRAYDSGSLAHQAIDNILSDNKLLKQRVQEMLYENSTRVSPAEKLAMRQLGVQLGLYPLRAQTEDALKPKKQKDDQVSK